MNTSYSKFERANALYAEIGRLTGDETLKSKEIYDEYNSLMEKYDFDNIIFSDHTGKKGVKWCWGEVMVPPIYDEVKWVTISGVPVESNFAICCRGGRDYLVNHHGEEILAADELKTYSALITPLLFRSGDKWGMADSLGNIIIEAKYDSIRPMTNGFTFFTINGKEGFIADGHIVGPRFENIEFDNDDYLTVTLNGEKGYLDENDEFSRERSDAYYKYEMFI